jgi:hypothetical protein
MYDTPIDHVSYLSMSTRLFVLVFFHLEVKSLPTLKSFGPMGSPTVCFDGLYFRPFVRRIISTFNFSANFLFI